MGFPREEYWNGLSFLSPEDLPDPGIEAASPSALAGGFFTTVPPGKSNDQFSSVAQSCLTLCNPVDYSLPGSSVHGIPQARMLEWGAIWFSKQKWTINKMMIFMLKTARIC